MYDKAEIINRIDIRSVVEPHIENLGRPDSNGWAMGNCCFHPEKHASLGFNLTSGAYKCHACDAKGDVFNFYQEIHGCDFKTAIKKLAFLAGVNGGNGNGTKASVKPQIVKIYNYQDESGSLVYQVCRLEPGYNGKKKSFFQRRPDGKGKWINNLEGVKPYLYHLSDVLKNQTILYVEGEKDCDNIRKKFKLPATTNSGGASKFPFELAEYFKGKDVVFLSDNDEAGRKHVEAIAGILRSEGIAKSIRIVDLPGLPEKGDVSDWIDAGGTKEDLQQLAENCPEWKNEPELFKDFPPLKPEQTAVNISTEPPPPDVIITYRGKPLLTRRIVVSVVGQGGISKTFLLQQLAYILADGTKLGPLEAASSEGFRVLMLCAEDHQDEVNRRLWAISRESGYFPSKLHMASTVGRLGPLMRLENNNPIKSDAWEWLRLTIQNHKGLDLLIIDPKSRFFGLSENDNDHGTQWISCLEALAQEFNLTILFSHHVSKANGKTMDQNMSRGASAIVDGCRLVAGLAALSETAAKRYGIDDPRGYIEFDIVKSNYAPGLLSKLIFKRTENGVLEYAALESERRTMLYSILYDAIEKQPLKFNKRDFARNENGTGEIIETIKLQFSKFEKKEIPGLIDEMLSGYLLDEKETENEGKGRRKKALETIPIDDQNFNQIRF